MNGELVEKANGGLGRLLDSGDIAIIALTTCLIFAIIGNIVQYFVGNSRQEKNFQSQNAMTLAMKGIEGAIDEVKLIFNILIDLVNGKKNVDKE